MLRILALFIVFSIWCLASLAQELIAEIPTKDEPIRAGGVVVGDHILLTIKPFGYASQSFILNTDGSFQASTFDFGNEELCAAIAAKQQYYTIREGKNKAVLSCYRLGERQKVAVSEPLNLDGRIFGTYIESDTLFVLTSRRKQFSLTVLQVVDGLIVKQQNFSLSADLLRMKRMYNVFIDQHTLPNLYNALAPVKLIKAGRHIFLTIDEAFREYEEPLPVYRSTVIRLDLNTGMTVIRVYMEPTNRPFHTYVAGNYILRKVNGDPGRVYDFDTNEMVAEIDFRDRFKANQHYFHYYNKKSVQLDTGTLDTGAPEEYLVGEMVGNKLTLTLGCYWLIETGVLILSPIGLVPGLIASAAISKAIPDVGLGSITYLEGPLHSLRFSRTSTYVKQRIDEFELQWQIEGRRFTCKHYTRIPNGVMAFYGEYGRDALYVYLFRN